MLWISPTIISCHILEALDTLRQAYHAFFFHAVASRRELLILFPPWLNGSDPGISCSKAWLWCLNKADCHIIVHLFHVDSNVHLIAKNSIHLYMPSSCDSWAFVRVQDSAPYSRTLSVTALKNCIFNYLGRWDFQMLSSLCSTGQVFTLHDAISMDVVLIHKLRYSKLVTHSQFFPSRLLRLWIWLSCS